MKTTRISELPIIPEEYFNICAKALNYFNTSSQMSPEERGFINGLIQYYQPKNILEIGVSKGGGTVNLLNAAAAVEVATSTEPAKVLSIDYYSGEHIGKIVTESYPELVRNNWQLIKGKDPSQALDEKNIKFDFAVIDSGHRHPCETLNFISILPFLNDGSIVVVHDIFIPNYKVRSDSPYFFAPRLLVSSVCAEKITPINSPTSPSNIMAFQITEDTRKYIRNVFDVLMFPWQYFDLNIVDSMRTLINKHYPPELQLIFESAVEMNKIPRGNDLTKLLTIADLESIYNANFLSYEHFESLEDDTIFYGAGDNCAKIISHCDENGIDFNFEIWDIAADSINESIFHKQVSLPDFDNHAKPSQKLVITILNPNLANPLQEQFEVLGYTVYRCLPL